MRPSKDKYYRVETLELHCVIATLLKDFQQDFQLQDGGGVEGSGGPAAAAAAAVVAMEDDWRQKRPATRALTVA